MSKNTIKVGLTAKEAEENMSHFFDTMNKGPKYQERQRIRKLKSQAMLLEPLETEYITVTVDKKYLGKWGK